MTLIDQIEQLKNELRSHRLYTVLADQEDLKTFMSHHIICVWDFMQILKSMQAEFAPAQVPWTPPKNALAARLVNDIVMCEESDANPAGGYKSHFEIYLDAMRELGVSTKEVEAIFEQLSAGVSMESAVKASNVPEAARTFSLQTLSILSEPVYVRAAVFFHSREGIIPDMFKGFVANLKEKGVQCDLLNYYLNRHIEVDEEDHGPMAEMLIDHLYGGDAAKKEHAEKVALSCLEARRALWDEIFVQISAQQANETGELYADKASSPEAPQGI